MAVKTGDLIKVEYTGTLDDGNVFDSSQSHGEPLEFEVGSGQIIKAFDDAVIGMAVGDQKSITILADDAYGQPTTELIRKVPKEFLASLPDAKPGMVLGLSDSQGNQMPAKIVEISDTEITLDLNHPLAGKTLHFTIKIVEIAS